MVVGLFLTFVHPLIQADRVWERPTTLCTIKDKAINESSGIAPSLRYDGEFYTHNDSGDKPRFFRFDVSGKINGTYTVKKAKAIDWEDVASANRGGRPMLYFGDVGDNFLKRNNIVVYRIEEPKEGGARAVKVDAEFKLTYPDGPQNCEAFFVTADGSLWLVSKSPVGDSRVYTIKAPEKKVENKLKFVGTLRTDTRGFGGKLVTGAAVSPDGRYVVVRTYSGAHEFKAPTKFEDWILSKPTTIRTATEK